MHVRLYRPGWEAVAQGISRMVFIHVHTSRCKHASFFCQSVHCLRVQRLQRRRFCADGGEGARLDSCIKGFNPHLSIMTQTFMYMRVPLRTGQNLTRL